MHSKMHAVATHVAWSVCVSASLLAMTASCDKTAEPIEMLFGTLTRWGPRNHVLVGGWILPREGALVGVTLGHIPRLAGGRYSQPSSQVAAVMRPLATSLLQQLVCCGQWCCNYYVCCF